MGGDVLISKQMAQGENLTLLSDDLINDIAAISCGGFMATFDKLEWVKI